MGANVRSLLIAATEELVVMALKNVKLSGDEDLLKTLLDEFTPVADAMMEALVNDKPDDWMGQLKIEPPGTDKQLSHFEGLQIDFRNALGGTISPEVVYGICKAVTTTPELRNMMKNRAKELHKGGDSAEKKSQSTTQPVGEAEAG